MRNGKKKKKRYFHDKKNKKQKYISFNTTTSVRAGFWSLVVYASQMCVCPYYTHFYYSYVRSFLYDWTWTRRGTNIKIIIIKNKKTDCIHDV